MYLIEIYKSVQGESSFAGVPCIFVRLAGCNLRCSWCDSEYTFTGGYKLTQDEVMAEIEKLAPVKLVEFTGGEPLLQEREVVPLMQRLLAAGYELMIETSGERPVVNVPEAVHKIVDVKCPGSGEANRFHRPNLASLTMRDELKFVISDRADYEYARDFIRTNSLEGRVGQLLLSPAFSKTPLPERSTANAVLDPRELVHWMLEDGLDARLSLQIHKYIWEPQKKGV
ncbi:7-carboxy-7-deazaguanine synthase QueE [Silvibacterium dinghuense]|uniref:7-carboxy-7-deazaguanine synthase n=1 Tax=Silvibacterium dinghuense TaxID=1560006 RepID=A0A4Q1SI83_9BACT|nr:radical SAM protein [Silvibacterium dinghuense]RXS97097.1 radical SAM protein [Silvibacterium dinghuense]GGG96184.1 7-carboxy-7-deazaguanine synthase [Silvibacterium dinghuense]